MAALEDLKTYLTTTLASSYSDAILSGVLDVELTDQGSRVKATHKLADLADWADHPSPLREAVMRRCGRNLALRKLPLGIAESEVSALRVAGRDNEVRRLEAPYLRLAVG